MSKSISTRLILHGKAAQREEVRAAVAAVRDQSLHLDVRVTWEKGDAARFAREAAAAQYATVIAGGGDGLINEVVGGLVDETDAATPLPSLGVVPLGTANDLARSCGIPTDPVAALELAVAGQAVPIDVGRANGRSFLNVATGGFGTEVTTETPEPLKQALGKAAYLLTGLTRFTSIGAAHARLTGPGLEWEGPFLVLAVGNGRQGGGGYQLCPEARLNDGLLDVRVLPQVSAAELLPALSLLLGDGLDAAGDTVFRGRVASLEVEAKDPLQLNLDGEPVADAHFRFEVLPKRLRMKLPPDCPLLT